MKPTLSELLVPLRLTAARLGRDKRGNAAVEFAVIVPVMLIMFFGTVEFSSAVAVNRKISMVAEELADLASRNKSVTDSDMTNFFNISNAELTPYSTTPLKAIISEIYIDPATGAARVQWSKAIGTVPHADSSTVIVPNDLIARDSTPAKAILPNQYFIFAETSYVYQPAVGYVMAPTGVTLSDKSYMRPRLSTCVFYSPATACTTK